MIQVDITNKNIEPVYVYDVSIIHISLFHRLIRFACADTESKNIYLQEKKTENKISGISTFWLMHLLVASCTQWVKNGYKQLQKLLMSQFKSCSH